MTKHQEMYALVPVRVRINTNSVAEISRAHKLVANVVRYWNDDVCAPYNAENQIAESAQEENRLYVREPSDAIGIVTKITKGA